MSPVGLEQYRTIPERVAFLQEVIEKMKAMPEPTDPFQESISPEQLLLSLAQSGQITISEYIELISKL